jgi:hypothetical protein
LQEVPPPRLGREPDTGKTALTSTLSGAAVRCLLPPGFL